MGLLDNVIQNAVRGAPGGDRAGTGTRLPIRATATLRGHDNR